MSAEAILEAVQTINPRTLQRARRLVRAIELRRAGVSRTDACVILQQRFRIDRVEAWRMVDAADDIDGRARPGGR